MNESTKDDARLRDAFCGAADQADPSSSCPDDETIWKAAQGEVDSETAGRVLDHTASCASCTESWRMARVIADEASVQSAATVLPFHRNPWVWSLGAVAAGIFLAALFLPAALDRRGTPPGDEFRDPTTVKLESRIDESAALPRDGVTLRWAGAPDGTIYTVEVVDEDLEILVRSAPREETEYPVPPEALVEVPDGGTVYWRVEAVLPDSSRVTSPVFLVKLR
jgi:hypothetical protein